MFLRPQKTQWFEIYVPRHETVRALGVLARTGSVELDADPKVNASLELGEIHHCLQELAQLEARYRDFLPRGQYCPVELPYSPRQTAEHTLERFRRWTGEVDAVRDRARQLDAERHNLEHLLKLFEIDGPAQPDLSRLAGPMRLLYVGLSECPLEEAIADLPDGALMEHFDASDSRFVVVAALPEQAPAIEELMSRHGCKPLAVPAGLSDDHVDNARRMRERLAALEARRARLQRDIDDLAKRHGVTELLGNIGVLKWYVEHAPKVETGVRFCHITGWTTDRDESHLTDVLGKEEIQGMVRFPQPPVGSEEPTGLYHNWWVQPFAFFTQLFGTPGEDEVDPTGLLFVIVPLLFGYMFPDVGHGALLILTGVVLAHRWPVVSFLIPCGIAAIAFGFVFGEFFGHQDIVPTLWVRPLDEPMAVMAIPLVGGVALMLLGILLAGLEAHWRGELLAWLAMDAAVLCMYASALATPFHPDAWRGILLGAGWYFAGGLALDYAQPLRRLGGLFGRLLESVYQLAVNTLSFARVGAFALGHIALSSALMTVLQGIDNPIAHAIVMVAGNLFIVAVEGLLVFVQTTRLVLFEFFIRFLRAEGRIFKPLRGPMSAG